MHRTPSSNGASLLFAGDSPRGGMYSQGRGFGTPSSAMRSASRMRGSVGFASEPRHRSGVLDSGGYGRRGGGGGGLERFGRDTPGFETPRGGGMGLGMPSSGARERRVPATRSSNNLQPMNHPSGARLRSHVATTHEDRDKPPTASYDDDEDDEAEALLAAVAPDMVGASTPGNRFGLFRGGTGSSDLVGANRSFAGYNDSGLDVGGGAMTADGGGLYGRPSSECWVTVFGFRPGMSDDALRYFQSYGTIISQKVSNSNWMHIQYETVDQANEAVGANGRPHEALGGYMIGVKRCSEADVMASGNHTMTPHNGHHRLTKAARSNALASTHLDSESIFKPRRRRKNVCTRMCEYLFKSQW